MKKRKHQQLHHDKSGLNLTIRILWIVVISLALFGFTLFFFIIFNKTFFNTSFQIDEELAAQFGSYIGGFVGTLFGITSTLLILVTLIKQNIENKKSLTGSNFFKMLDYHTDNVRQLSISDIDSSEEVAVGRRAFVIFKKQLTKLFPIVYRINRDLELNLNKEKIIDLAYIAFYYGIDDDSKKFSNTKLSGFEKNEMIALLLKEEKLKSKIKIGRSNQTSLSSYFRNLYNAVKLIDSDKYLTLDEKKQYIKILRAQLSDPELYIFFFNIMSRFGKKWKENDYIERYELIKNIPLDYLGEFNPKDFFSMEYEEEEIN